MKAMPRLACVCGVACQDSNEIQATGPDED